MSIKAGSVGSETREFEHPDRAVGSLSHVNRHVQSGDDRALVAVTVNGHDLTSALGIRAAAGQRNIVFISDASDSCRHRFYGHARIHGVGQVGEAVNETGRSVGCFHSHPVAAGIRNHRHPLGIEGDIKRINEADIVQCQHFRGELIDSKGRIWQVES